MNRCPALSPFTRWRLILTVLLASWALLPAAAQAPHRIPPIPARAAYAMLVVTAAPEVLLNGSPDRLSPGARVHSPNNLLTVPASLVDQALAVRYVRDMMGLIHEVWILTDAERQEAAYAPDTPLY